MAKQMQTRSRSLRAPCCFRAPKGTRNLGFSAKPAAKWGSEIFTIMCASWSERYSNFGLMQGTAASGHRKPSAGSWFGPGCTGNRMLSKHEHYYGFGDG